MELHTREVPPRGAPRKLYQKPRLEVYGNLGALTQAVTNMGEMDGAKGKAHGTALPPG
jgi:hypothetical protein